MADTMALDSNNDIFLDRGRIARVTNGAQVVQMVRSRLLFYLGEWRLDSSAGLPYRQEYLRKGPNLPQMELRIIQEIAGTFGVEEVTEFNLNFDSASRLASIQFSAETIFGSVQGVTINVNRS